MNMLMKVGCILLLLLEVFLVVNSLQLTSNKENHESYIYHPKHAPSIFGRNYRSHKADEYVQKVKEDNKKKIQDFNNKNKKVLRSVGGSSSGGDLVTGGHSFVMGQTKFIQFTQEEFQKMFTGLRHQPAHHSHRVSSLQKQEAPKQPSGNSGPVNRKLTRHLLHKIDRSFAPNKQQMQSHYEQVYLCNHKKSLDKLQKEQHEKNSWSFYDPYQIDDDYLSYIYGDVNSDDNYGWDWQHFDQNYYSDFGQDSIDQYYSYWQNDHWDNDQWQNNQDYADDDWWWNNDQQDADDGWGTYWNTQQGDNDDGWNYDEQIDYVKPAPKPEPKPNPTPAPAPSSKIIEPYSQNSVEVNWVSKGGTTHIKQQGICGSCWAYAAIGVMEAFYLINGKGIMDLSQQQLVDCQKRLWGCEGGLVNVAFDYVINNGLVVEAKYPYRGVDQKCEHQSGPHKIAKYTRIQGRSNMQNALRKGPIGGAVYADDGFQFYVRGIFDACKKQDPNHAIVIVGYTKDYWIIRNSWGSNWGEQGHMRLKKDQNSKNACMIEDQAFSVTQ